MVDSVVSTARMEGKTDRGKWEGWHMPGGEKYR